MSESTPEERKAMYSFLKDCGVTEFDESLLKEMLDFTYRYVTTTIEDAKLYSSHAEEKDIDIEDVKLAICLQNDKNFVNPLSRELTSDLSGHRNSVPLPPVRPHAGLQLPPDQHSLTACTFHKKLGAKRPKTAHTIARLNAAHIPGSLDPSFSE